jgi:hypothetical protein
VASAAARVCRRSEALEIAASRREAAIDERLEVDVVLDRAEALGQPNLRVDLVMMYGASRDSMRP